MVWPFLLFSCSSCAHKIDLLDGDFFFCSPQCCPQRRNLLHQKCLFVLLYQTTCTHASILECFLQNAVVCSRGCVTCVMFRQSQSTCVCIDVTCTCTCFQWPWLSGLPYVIYRCAIAIGVSAWVILDCVIEGKAPALL